MKRTAIFPVVLWLGLAVFSSSTAWGLPKVSVAAVPKPTAQVTRFELQAFSLRDVTFLMDVTVKNPYPVDLSFNGLTLDFAVEGQPVFHTETQNGFKIPGKQEKSNAFTVTLAYAGIINTVKNYMQKDWLNTHVHGTLVLPLPKMAGLPPDITFTYDFDKKIPAIKPTVTLENFTVAVPDRAAVGQALAAKGSQVNPDTARGFLQDLLAGKRTKQAPMNPTEIDVPITVSVTLVLANSAQAPLRFSGLNYTLFMDDNQVLNGKTDQVRVQGTTTFVTIKSTFSTRQLGEGLQKTFAARKGRFQIKGEALVGVPPEIRSTPIPLAFDESGNFTL